MTTAKAKKAVPKAAKKIPPKTKKAVPKTTKKTPPKAKRAPLKVIDGGKVKAGTRGKAKTAPTAKKAPPKTRKVSAAKKAPTRAKVKTPVHKAKISKQPVKKKRILPANQWRSVLRLPEKTAKRLRRAAKKNDLSVNGLIETVLEVYLKEEGV